MAPTLVNSYPVYLTNWQAAPGPVPLTVTFTPAAGEILVIKVISENSARVAQTPTGVTTPALQVSDVTSSSCGAWIWTAIAAGSPTTVTVQSGSATPAHAGMVVERWSWAQIAASPATCDTVGTSSGSGSNPAVATIAGIAATSAVTWLLGDYAAATGTPIYSGASGTPAQDGYDAPSGAYTGYWASQTVRAAGTQTIGVASGVSGAMTFTILGLEVQSAATGVPSQSVRGISMWR